MRTFSSTSHPDARVRGWIRTLFLAVLLAVPGGALDTVPAAKATPSAAANAGWPDHGLLEPAYFDLDPSLMKETKQADFFYAKPGLSLKGLTLKVAWEAPRWLVTTEEKLELEVARRLTNDVFPQALATTMAASLWPGARVSRTEGDLLLTGRLVMINVRNGWWSQTREALTFDLKVVDPATREVLIACHHRFVSHPGSFQGKGRDLERRVEPWALELSEFCRANFLN